MARKRIKYKKFIGFVYIAIAFVMIYTLVANVIRIKYRQDDLANLTKQRDSLATERDQLSEEVSLLNDDDYVVRYAREHYIFTQDGEEVATLPESKK